MNPSATLAYALAARDGWKHVVTRGSFRSTSWLDSRHRAAIIGQARDFGISEDEMASDLASVLADRDNLNIFESMSILSTAAMGLGATLTIKEASLWPIVRRWFDEDLCVAIAVANNSTVRSKELLASVSWNHCALVGKSFRAEAHVHEGALLQPDDLWHILMSGVQSFPPTRDRVDASNMSRHGLKLRCQLALHLTACRDVLDEFNWGELPSMGALPTNAEASAWMTARRVFARAGGRSAPIKGVNFQPDPWQCAISAEPPSLQALRFAERDLLLTAWAQRGKKAIAVLLIAYIQAKGRFRRAVALSHTLTGLREFVAGYQDFRGAEKGFWPKAAGAQFRSHLIADYIERQSADKVDLRCKNLTAGAANRKVRAIFQGFRSPKDDSNAYRRNWWVKEMQVCAVESAKLNQSIQADRQRQWYGVDVVAREIGWTPAAWLEFFLVASEAKLRISAHVGEGFHSPLTALRHISEFIELIAICRQQFGGKHLKVVRIGHATAARIQTDAWYKLRRPRPLRWALVLDLIWLSPFLDAEGCLEADALLAKIWPGRCDGKISHRAIVRSHASCTCAEVAVPPKVPTDLRHQVAPDCFDDSGTLYDFNPTDSIKRAIVHAQKWVRRKLNSEGFVVEINPTSNATISGLGWTEALEFGTVKCKLRPALKCVLGSDDPGPFLTDIVQEEALLSELGTITPRELASMHRNARKW